MAVERKPGLVFDAGTIHASDVASGGRVDLGHRTDLRQWKKSDGEAVLCVDRLRCVQGREPARIKRGFERLNLELESLIEIQGGREIILETLGALITAIDEGSVVVQLVSK